MASEKDPLKYITNCRLANTKWSNMEQRNETDLDQVPLLWWNKAVELNIANSGELVKIYSYCWNSLDTYGSRILQYYQSIHKP